MKPTAFYARDQKSEVRDQALLFGVLFFPRSTVYSLRSVFRGLRSLVCRPQSAVYGLRPASAFTLIELLVAMVVAAIIMAVSLPSFINMGRGAGMRGAVNNVSSTIALSRQWAITHREEITFFAASNLAYQKDNGVWVTNPAYCAKNQTNEVVHKGVPLPADVTFAPPGGGVVTSLTFKTDGGLAGGADVNTIVLMEKKDNSITKTITVNRWTGGVTVE